MTISKKAGRTVLVLAAACLGLWAVLGNRQPRLSDWQAALRAGRAFHEFCVKESLSCDHMDGRGLGKAIDGGGFEFEFASSDTTPNAIILVDVLPSQVNVRPLGGSLELLKKRQ